MRYIFLFFILILFLTGCGSKGALDLVPINLTNVTNLTNITTEVNVSTPQVIVVEVPKVPDVPKGQYLVSLLSEKSVSYDGKKYALTVVSANSRDDSVELEIDRDGDMDTERVSVDDFVSSNGLSFCVVSVTLSNNPTTADIVILPLSKPMTALSKYVDNRTCTLFTSYADLSASKVFSSYFVSKYSEDSDSDFIEGILETLTKVEPSEISMVAWEYYLDSKSREDMISAIVSTKEFEKASGLK